ncbi:hypothetical protein Ngar_c18010 [Candidatus Nitrososphaera gargensis Ga9.2]|uniref:Uncharacterized protein n=1 Tax=Nitrososphaera gargensis (strain Ga9.2) TaxID=1237085 RepID=K0IN45_NITGG|nr:hypothetical protein [Candidatus Nitrososphaera gargensis]AFU58734.1 hypothetical protein Ngar_c18010 [Candidatus Nitrososphaera gargensis Ga9.2]
MLPVQNGKITKISNGTTFLRDWSSDGRFIIGDNLVMISPNGIILQVPEGLEEISIPSISPSNDQLLFIAKHEIEMDTNYDVFKYKLSDGSIQQLTNNPKLTAQGLVERIVGAEWLSNGRILYVQSETDTKDTSHQTSSLDC